MTIVEAFKKFFLSLTGEEVSGDTIEAVIRSGADKISAQKESGTNSVVLNSSTEGSVKKFNVTVDDSGTITATEVTE